MADEEIIEVKPGFAGVSVDIRALLRRLTGVKARGRVAIVADRFLSVFSEHGVAPSQIPLFFPELTLDTLNSDERLLRALTSNVLTEVAKLFRVRREWLEGVDDRIYDRNWCYKAPERLFEALKNAETEFDSFPIRILHSEDLDFRRPCTQPMVMLLIEKVRELGEELVPRFQIWDECDWSHPPCRIQLKAMARVLDRRHREVVPLYRVSSKDFAAVAEGRCIPKRFMRGSPLTDPSLEDYALTAEESKVAKETEELPFVLEYIESQNLWPSEGDQKL
jgi:hypothetical protein